MAYMTVCPNDLRFTQDSIKNTFRPPHDNLLLDQAVDRIRKKLLSADDFPALNVVKHGGILWSLDNRRLWVFRKAKVTVIEVKLVSLNYSPRSAGFFRDLEPSLERRYSSPSYYPRVRGYIGCIPLESPAYLRDEAAAPKLAQEDTKKFSEPERVRISESNTILVANRPAAAAAQYLKPDINGRVHGQEGFAESGDPKGRFHGQEVFAESGGSKVWEMLEIGIAVAGIGWGAFRLLSKFM